MALEFAGFVGTETQGGEETIATAGTPVVNTTTVHGRGAASLELDGAGTVRSATYEFFTTGSSDQGAGYGVSIHFRTPNTTEATGNVAFVQVRDSSDGLIAAVGVEADGDIILIDSTAGTVGTITTPFSNDTWYRIDLYIGSLNDTTGELRLRLYEDDGTLIDQADSTTADTDSDNTPNIPDDVFVESRNSFHWLFDDAYWFSGGSGVSDFFSGEILRPYQNTAEDATDQGDTLSSGSWGDASETPRNDTNDAQYTGGSALAGDTITDEGSRSGPSGHADADGTFKAAKWTWRAQRSGGSATGHFFRYGNSGDGTTDTADPGLTTSLAHYHQISAAASAMPTSSESFRIGFGKDGAGTQGIRVTDQWAQLLQEPPAAGAASPEGFYHHRHHNLAG